MVAFWARALPSVGTIEYAEGDTGTWVWMLRHGEAIYGGAEALPMRHANYPPLGLSLVAKLAPSDGAILVTGRLVSLCGFALMVALVGLSVKRATGSASAGALASMALLATMTTGFWAAVCRPDALAAATGTLGVTMVAHRVRGWPLLAGLAFAASLLVKHSLVVFPLGTVAWALVRQPRRGALLALTTVAPLAIVVWTARLGEPLLTWSSGEWRAAKLLTSLGEDATPLSLGVAAAVVALRRWNELPARAREVAGPWSGVLVVGLAWALALGRVGASFNYLIELATATVVLATIAATSGLGRRLYLSHALVSVLYAGVWLGIMIFDYVPRSAVEQRAAVAALAGSSGPVLAEQTWWATGAGRPPLVIPFLSTQLAAADRFDPTPLARAAAAGTIDRVLLGFPLEEPAAVKRHSHADRFAPIVLDALRSRYERESSAGELYIYRPRRDRR